MSQAPARRYAMTSIRRLLALVALVIVVALVSACQSASAAQSRTIALATLNNSGVTGTVTLTALDERHTRIEIQVDPAGHLDMPSHIHPGTCSNLVPQPKYPLQNVKGGRSTTIVTASFGELVQGGLAVNLHSSNEDLKTYTACAELK
jgi:hypothetical protein